MLPLIRGLYLADRVEVDPVSQNLTLVNCFRGFRLPRLPGPIRPFAVVAYLANGVGDFEALVRVERMDTLAEVFRARTRLHLPDRLTEVRFVLQLAGGVLSVAGEYSVSLWFGDELLAQTPFHVRVAPEANEMNERTDDAPEGVFESLNSPIIMVSEADGSLTRCEPEPLTAAVLLQLMRERIKYYGAPLPDGFAPPSGIDLAELLKRVPWPPAA